MSCNPFDIIQRPQSNTLFVIPIILFMFTILLIGFQEIEQYNQHSTVNLAALVEDRPLNSETKKFKNIKTPSNGTVQLIKGVGKVVHHSIKEDSVIMLSRKNIEGTAGHN